MKLVYVFLGGSQQGSSVQNKIIAQIRALNNHGIETKGWLFSPSIDEPLQLNSYAVLMPIARYQGTPKYFKTYYENQYYYQEIHKYLKAHEGEYGCIFLRHGASGPSYFELLKQFGHKLFLYIPSNSIRENFRERQYAEPNGIVGQFFRWWEYFKYFYLWEKKLFRTVIDKLAGVVVFTPEFAGILNRQNRNKAKMIYNRDGADCARVHVRNPSYIGSKVRLLFMKGSGLQQPWSGLKRLIESIESTGEGRFELVITGNVYNSKEYEKPFVTLTGRLSDGELEVLTNEVDLGVSNLANYLIDFNETTNLKSREYFARGLPFIQANTMPDIDGTEAEGYYLNLPNNSSLINMDEVFDFAMKMRSNTNHPHEMRSFAEKHLDWEITVGELAVELKRHMAID